MAFVIGFQNNSAYGRIWEARKIWGGIVNTSRTFGMFLQDMITNEYAKQKVADEQLNQEIKTLTYRHIAWMTVLRHAMRQPKPWETILKQRTNREWGLIGNAGHSIPPSPGQIEHSWPVKVSHPRRMKVSHFWI